MPVMYRCLQGHEYAVSERDCTKDHSCPFCAPTTIRERDAEIARKVELIARYRLGKPDSEIEKKVGKELRALAHQMILIAEEMECYPDAEWAKHASELRGASKVARQWAKEIDKEAS